MRTTSLTSLTAPSRATLTAWARSPVAPIMASYAAQDAGLFVSFIAFGRLPASMSVMLGVASVLIHVRCAVRAAVSRSRRAWSSGSSRPISVRRMSARPTDWRYSSRDLSRLSMM